MGRHRALRVSTRYLRHSQNKGPQLSEKLVRIQRTQNPRCLQLPQENRGHRAQRCCKRVLPSCSRQSNYEHIPHSCTCLSPQSFSKCTHPTGYVAILRPGERTTMAFTFFLFFCSREIQNISRAPKCVPKTPPTSDMAFACVLSQYSGIRGLDLLSEAVGAHAYPSPDTFPAERASANAPQNAVSANLLSPAHVTPSHWSGARAGAAIPREARVSLLCRLRGRCGSGTSLRPIKSGWQPS